VKLTGDCLHIGFDVDQEFFREQLEKEDLRRLLEKTASECAGRPLRVEVALSQPKEESLPEPTGETPAPSPDALRERALKEPLVRSFLETFQGEIEEVRPLTDASPDEASEGSTK
jgi:hypothetical protein